MASRQDELNAYTFARRRTLGAFLQPAGGGSDEDAPRALRAVLPSVVAGALAVAAFGAWGLIRPAAPKGWDDGDTVIVGKQSTTRYVILKNGSQKVLHPVLNMASARLLLDPARARVVVVEDDVVDRYPRRGATIGIPYAPDKLPTPTQARTPKTWAVCDRDGRDVAGVTTDQAVLVLDQGDAQRLRDGHRLTGGRTLYVKGPDGTEYLVDAGGTAYRLEGQAQGMTAQQEKALRIALFGTDGRPQAVTAQWLRTLAAGDPISLPRIPGSGTPSTAQLSDRRDKVVGRVLADDPDGDGRPDAYYVVRAHWLERVTPFVARLLLNEPTSPSLQRPGRMPWMSPQDRMAVKGEAGLGRGWPKWDTGGPAVNAPPPYGGVTRGVLCSVYDGVAGGDGGRGAGVTRPGDAVRRTVWAGTTYPVTVPEGGTSAYVSPGGGLLYRAVSGTDGRTGSGSGSVYLLTETGLRYPISVNGDSTTSPPRSGGARQAGDAQVRLGYQGIVPAPVPTAWSDLVPVGPVLDSAAAAQLQRP